MTAKAVFLPLLLLFSARLCANGLFPPPHTAAPSEPKQAERQPVRHYSGTVTAVSDGDTLRLTDTHGRKHKVRLAYIDAPELQQAHGHTARKALEAAVLGQTVEVRVFDTDRYRREVAQVWSNRQDINLMQIARGHAWHYAAIAKRRQNKTDYAAYAYAEARARNEKQGLWHNLAAQAPWNFRKTEREKQHGTAVW